MANAFAKAAAKAAVPQPKGKEDATIFTPTDDTILTSVDEFIDAKERAKKAESDQLVAQNEVMPWARKEYYKLFSKKGVTPEKMSILGKSGKMVKLIFQDRSGKYDISPETLETLKTLLGVEKAEALVEETTDYSFDNAILYKDGVMDALGEAINGLVEKGLITAAESENILKAKPRRVVKKGVLDRLPDLCDNDSEQMQSVAEALGSNIVNYIQ